MKKERVFKGMPKKKGKLYRHSRPGKTKFLVLIFISSTRLIEMPVPYSIHRLSTSPLSDIRARESTLGSPGIIR